MAVCGWTYAPKGALRAKALIRKRFPAVLVLNTVSPFSAFSSFDKLVLDKAGF